jgi:hypothetical protein
VKRDLDWPKFWRKLGRRPNLRQKITPFCETGPWYI